MSMFNATQATPTPAATPRVTVPVVSGWLSKINWTNAIAVIATVLTLATGNKLSIPADVQTGIVAVIGAGSSLVTMILRTYFTTTIVVSAAKTVTSA